ncbi:SDR family oxidoreductase [Lysobacter sp. A3-1-A15]|uniref:SDR family oxidoreductase n=1 Tax=Novilysobacter viscosus TaxID=3098602 RepID=UPI002ED8537A
MQQIGTVLVVGAGGFIGGFIVSALRAAGYRVLEGKRPGSLPPGPDGRECDVARMCQPAHWAHALQGADAVVNAAGILRESPGNTFQQVHHDGPLALARACVAAGVGRFVQISALGDPRDGGFIASKHRFDEALSRLPLEAVVFRPSVVYAVAGSYGGTSLLRALAAAPGAQWLPGRGEWQLQPLAAEDLGVLVVRALQAGSGVFDVAGPQAMSLAEYQQHWRSWLRVPGRAVIRVPEALVGGAVAVMDAVGAGPMGRTMWRMLRRGNVAAPDAHARLASVFGTAPRALADVLAARPSQVQDRWHAQLHLLGPLLRAALVVLWLLSAWAGFATPAARIEALAGDGVLAALEPVLLARAGGVVDLLLALWLASGWRPRAALAVMLLAVVAYTLVFGLLLPASWLDPLGGLAKNLVVIPAVAVAWVLADRR